MADAGQHSKTSRSRNEDLEFIDLYNQESTSLSSRTKNSWYQNWAPRFVKIVVWHPIFRIAAVYKINVGLPPPEDYALRLAGGSLVGMLTRLPSNISVNADLGGLE